MPTQTIPLEVGEALTALGQRIRTARVRRRMTQDELAAACEISRKTLYGLETGARGTTVPTLLTVLWKLGLLADAAHLADADTDEHGKTLEAARRSQRVRKSAQRDEPLDF